MSRLRCACGFEVEGDPAFVAARFDAHEAAAHPAPPAVARNELVRRTIVGLSGLGSPLRARLEAAAADLAGAGMSPQDIALRLESGESGE